MSRYDDPAEAGWQSGPQAKSRWFHRYSLRTRIFGIVSCITALVLVCGSLFLYVKYREVWDSIKHVDVSSDLQGKRPAEDPDAMNILLIGSDSRSGGNGKIGGRVGISGARSDTVMVLHVAPGEHKAVVLSFPRDSVVPILKCSAEAGTTGQTAQPAPNVEQLNSTFAYGGPGCLWKTIEQTTHIRLNDFIELTFTGFEKVIDDLGGVSVCLPEKVNDPMSGLKLSAGRHHVWGREALAFWRTREDLGEGSDLQRIQRDQFLMAALVQGIEKSGLLTSPTKIAKVVADAAKSMTTNISDVTTMLHIAESLRGLHSKNVQFIQIPTQEYAPNPNWVQWTPQASQLFSAIAHNSKLPKTAKSGKKKSGGATLDSVSPSQVKVDVLNGSGLQGQAAEGAADLTSRGFKVVGSGNAANFNYTDSVVEYSSAADLPAAKTLEAQVSNVEILQNSSLTPGTVELILGSSFSSLKARPPAASKSGSATANLAKKYGGITGNVNVCKDKGAFAGPDGS